jgi:hypothetical protein
MTKKENSLRAVLFTFVITSVSFFNAFAIIFPNRKLSTIQGVFISDSAAHVALGFTPPAPRK